MSWYPPSVWGYHLWNVFAFAKRNLPQYSGWLGFTVVQSYSAWKDLLEGCTRARQGWPERDKASQAAAQPQGSSAPYHIDAPWITRNCKKPLSTQDFYLAWRSWSSPRGLGTGLHFHITDLFSVPGVYLWIPKQESTAFITWTYKQRDPGHLCYAVSGIQPQIISHTKEGGGYKQDKPTEFHSLWTLRKHNS